MNKEETKLKLEQFVSNIEKLIEDKRKLQEEITDIKSEAKKQGFNVSIINEVIKLRKLPVEQRNEKLVLLDTYLENLGILKD
jgi:uncharacterized protein (UPF0335 family)